MYLRACSRDVHAAAIYGAETLAVSPPYGGSNRARYHLYLGHGDSVKVRASRVRAFLSPSCGASRVPLAHTYYPGNVCVTRALSLLFVRSYIYLLPRLFLCLCRFSSSIYVSLSFALLKKCIHLQECVFMYIMSVRLLIY